MSVPEFSRPGDPPTAYEVELLLAAVEQPEHDWLWVAQQMIQSLGQEAGTRALLIVLDSLRGEKSHVPAREHLFAMLHRPRRDREVLRLVHDVGMNFTEAGAVVGIGADRVRQIVERAGRRSPAVAGKSRG